MCMLRQSQDITSVVTMCSQCMSIAAAQVNHMMTLSMTIKVHVIVFQIPVGVISTFTFIR